MKWYEKNVMRNFVLYLSEYLDLMLYNIYILIISYSEIKHSKLEKPLSPALCRIGDVTRHHRCAEPDADWLPVLSVST